MSSATTLMTSRNTEGKQQKPTAWLHHTYDELAAALYNYTYTTVTALVSQGTLHVFERNFALEDAICPHACSLEASKRVTNSIPLGYPLL
jgi:hypothetical protein